MKKGFALLELLLAMLIATLLTGLLFSIVYQVNKAYGTVVAIADGHSRALAAMNILTRDIAGATIPLQFLDQMRNDASKKQQKSSMNQEPSARTKSLEKIFFGAEADDAVTMLTFITMNALSTYFDDVVGKPKARISRVTYRLKADSKAFHGQKAYILWRSEHVSLDAPTADDEAKEAYELVAGVKSMKIMYSALIDEKSPKEQLPQKTPPVYELKPYATWNVEVENGIQELRDRSIVLPALVEITLVLWSSDGKKEETYRWSVDIMALKIAVPLVQPPPPEPPGSKSKSGDDSDSKVK